MSIHYGQYVVPSEEVCAKLSVGQPSTSMLPLNIVKEGCKYIQSLKDPLVLQYGDIKGYLEFRKDLAKLLESKYKNEVDPEDLFITNGNSDAFYFILSLLQKTGSTVYMEKPTYFLGINIAQKDLGMNVVSVGMDEHNSIDLDELDKLLEKDDDSQIRILYTVPTCHNPTSSTMSHYKRIRLGELTKKHKNFIVVADEVYQLLNFVGTDDPPMPMCYYTNNAISLGSFSKITAPGLRLGWMHIKNKELMNRFVDSGKMDSSGGCSPLIQALVHGIIKNGDFEKHLEMCREFLSKNCDMLSKYVDELLSEHVVYEKPEGGYFLWLKLVNGLKADDVLKEAVKNKVTFVSGSKFSVDSSCDEYIRISFSYYDDGGFKEGVSRLKDVMDSMIDMRGKVRVSVLGYNGRLGKMIVDNVTDDQDCYMTSYIKRDMEVDIDNTDVIVDVSRPDGTKSLLTKLIKELHKVPLVIGTTGDLPYDEIYKYSERAPVMLLSNFSRGVPQVCKLLKSVDNDEWNISILEKHHVHKKDAPSGTAKTLADIVNVEYKDVESIREGEVIGEHTVILDNEYEKVVIEHIAKDRTVFAVGAVRCCKNIVDMDPGLYYGQSKDIKIEFSKYSGCGNDFLIVDNDIYHMNKEKMSKFTQQHCRRGMDIGADGCIFVSRNENNLNWVYMNADGNSVEMCGNGARCVVQWGLDHGMKADKLINNFGIETNVLYEKNRFSIEMPKCTQVSYLNKYVFDNCHFQGKVNVGVPHLVFESSEDISPIKLGELYRDDDSNVNVYQIINKDKMTAKVRTYERGIWDETLACGSGCCAVAYTIKERFKDIDQVNIMVQSGHMLKVKFIGDQMYLRGSARKVFDGCV